MDNNINPEVTIDMDELLKEAFEKGRQSGLRAAQKIFVTEIEKMLRACEVEEICLKTAYDHCANIDILGLSARTRNALINRGINTISDVLEHDRLEDLFRIRGLGATGRNELIDKMSGIGIKMVTAKRRWD